jgi:hypothetical protein
MSERAIYRHITKEKILFDTCLKLVLTRKLYFMWFVARMARTGRPCLLEQRSLSRLISWWQLFQLATVECFRHNTRPENGIFIPIGNFIFLGKSYNALLLFLLILAFPN